MAKPLATCCDCWGDGWGPMLRSEVWRKIEPQVQTLYFVRSQPNLYRWGKFLCEPCVEKRLGGPVCSYHLRDCPMNSNHPNYIPHGGM